jgi:hypothetical protein
LDSGALPPNPRDFLGMAPVTQCFDFLQAQRYYVQC